MTGPLERDEQSPLTTDNRAHGALAGVLIGDALAMPVHWYYDRAALRKEYGEVRDYLPPRHPHSGSILWRSSYQAANERGEILHDQARFWGQRDVHYHRLLEAGENTLTAKLFRLTLRSLDSHDGHDADAYLEEYIAYLGTPGTHRDTYLEECHRGFFTNYAKGLAPRRCAVTEKHIGGLTPMLAVALAYRHDQAKGTAKAIEHLGLTHAGKKMEEAGRLLLEILYATLAGAGLRDVIDRQIAGQRSALLGHPFRAWLDREDSEVVGARLSTACYVEDSVPAVLYLALKYHDRPEQALIVNTNLGGDNVHRGSVLGCLLGAEHGLGGWPARWLDGLRDGVPSLPTPQGRNTA